MIAWSRWIFCRGVYYGSSNALHIKGRRVCVIDKVVTPIPLSAQLEEILAICYAWEPPGARKTRYVAEGTLIDAFVSTLFLVSSGNKGVIAEQPESFSVDFGFGGKTGHVFLPPY
jgi:hypothetical protein